MEMDGLIALLGEEVEDPEEETFLLCSHPVPSSNLGFIDPKATTLEISVGEREFSITQSPGLLSSSRKEGTTGAVVWKITPLFASWLVSKGNILVKCGIPHAHANVLELGCGVSGLISLALAAQPDTRAARYINTDQEYVLKYVRENVERNFDVLKDASRSRKKTKGSKELAKTEIETMELDWETSDTSNLYKDLGIEHLDLLISCDCIYNEALVDPLVNTMRDICALAPSGKQTVVVVAQQLRSPEVLETFLRAFHAVFRVWRIPDERLIEGLKEGSGFAVHIGLLRFQPHK